MGQVIRVGVTRGQKGTSLKSLKRGAISPVYMGVVREGRVTCV